MQNGKGRMTKWQPNKGKEEEQKEITALHMQNPEGRAAAPFSFLAHQMKEASVSPWPAGRGLLQSDAYWRSVLLRRAIIIGVVQVRGSV